MEIPTQQTSLISEDVLLQYNIQGFFPGPQESEQNFIQRIHNSKIAYSNMHNEIFNQFKDALLLQDSTWKTIEEKSLSLCGFYLKNTLIFYSNKKLPFWQGAATWISDTASIVQLRKGFQKQGRHLGFYLQDEILIHEAVHIARSAFQEPRFEEILAYRTSPYFWRRWIGPLFRYPWESGFLLFLLTLGLCIPFGWALPYMFLGYLGCRLVYNQILLTLCLKKLSKLVGPKAFMLALRLPDKCIANIALMSHKKTQDLLRNTPSLLGKLIASLARAWNS